MLTEEEFLKKVGENRTDCKLKAGIKCKDCPFSYVNNPDKISCFERIRSYKKEKLKQKLDKWESL